MHKLCKKEPKMMFLAIFLSFVYWINFKLHISIVLIDLDKWAVISPALDPSKLTKKPFRVIQRAKDKVFGHFLEFGAS